MNMAYYAFLKQAKRWDQTRAGERQRAYDEMREELVTGFVKSEPRSGDENSLGAWIDFVVDQVR